MMPPVPLFFKESTDWNHNECKKNGKLMIDVEGNIFCNKCDSKDFISKWKLRTSTKFKPDKLGE